MILRQHVTFLFVLFFAPAGRKTTHKDLIWVGLGRAIAAVAITIHIIPYMLDRGYSAGFAAGTASLIGAMKFLGRRCWPSTMGWRSTAASAACWPCF